MSSSVDIEAVPDFLELGRLQGRRMVVIGAGAGMGRQSAHALAQAGARVACVDLDGALAAKVAEEVGGLAITADITKREVVEQVFSDAVSEFGGVDGVVDVVGLASIGKFVDVDDERWDWQFDMVLRHAFYVLQIGARHLTEAGGGTMVFVGSMSGIRGVLNQSAYGSAKAALHHLVSCVGAELAATGVRVNGIAPGWVRTPRLERRLPDEESWQTVNRMIPRGSPASPSEIAGPILFLSSGLSSYVTGHVLRADGGLSVVAPFPDIL